MADPVVELQSSVLLDNVRPFLLVPPPVSSFLALVPTTAAAAPAAAAASAATPPSAAEAALAHFTCCFSGIWHPYFSGIRTHSDIKSQFPTVQVAILSTCLGSGPRIRKTGIAPVDTSFADLRGSPAVSSMPDKHKETDWSKVQDGPALRGQGHPNQRSMHQGGNADRGRDQDRGSARGRGGERNEQGDHRAGFEPQTIRPAPHTLHPCTLNPKNTSTEMSRGTTSQRPEGGWSRRNQHLASQPESHKRSRSRSNECVFLPQSPTLLVQV